jgi:hypothetical protein
MVPAIALVLILRVLLRAVFSPLRSVPGPFLARFTDAWYFWNVHKGSFEEINAKLHNKYGKVIAQPSSYPILSSYSRTCRSIRPKPIQYQ